MNAHQSYFDHKPQAKKRKLNVLPNNPEKSDPKKPVGLGRFPSWLHRTIPPSQNLLKTHGILNTNRLPTVCEEARCPNLFECYSQKTATFLAMGSHCTRACGFCDIDFAVNPPPLEADEPSRLAKSVKQLGLKHVVITMVARDDLSDGGAHHLVTIIQEVRKQNPGVTIEVLTSDFSGDQAALEVICSSEPEIFNHNIETVRELSPRVRHKATYDRTLNVLQKVANMGRPILVKSGLMLGLGESKNQVLETLKDLYSVGCEAVTICQYLQPNRNKLRVKKFISPQEFKEYAAFGENLGIKQVFAGPFVRSSYNASSLYNQLRKQHG